MKNRLPNFFRLARSTVGVMVLASLLWACNQQDDSNRESSNLTNDRPNILLIVADDLGYSDIGSFGGEIATPTLDALAQAGFQLTNFHVLPTCSPSRSVLLSGTDNHTAGLGTMGEFIGPELAGQPGYEGYLNFEVAALPEILSAAGYHTYIAGKWHLGHDSETSPFARGFDETFALIPGGGSHWSDRKPLSPTQPMDYQRNGVLVDELPADFYSTRAYTDYMLDWIGENHEDGAPFFGYLSYTAPHDPLHAPQEYIDKYTGTYDGGWDVLRETRLQNLKDLGIINENAQASPRLPTVPAWEDLSPEHRAEEARNMEVYAAMVDYLDDEIGRVIDYLKEIDEYDNTMIIFLSDNGANGASFDAYPGQTQEYTGSFDNSLENRGLPNSLIEMGPGWAQASMAPSRMFKGFPSEGGIRAPLLIKLPGEMKNAGQMDDSFMHIRDLMPTILDLADIEHSTEFNGREVEPMQGQSLLSYFAGEASEPYASAGEVGYELFGMKAQFDGDWKIIMLQEPFGTGDWQLYNVREDPGEINDLSAQYPEQRQALITLWEQYREDHNVLENLMDMASRIN